MRAVLDHGAGRAGPRGLEREGRELGHRGLL